LAGQLPAYLTSFFSLAMSGVVSGITRTQDSAWALSKLNAVIGIEPSTHFFLFGCQKTPSPIPYQLKGVFHASTHDPVLGYDDQTDFAKLPGKRALHQWQLSGTP
jgi:hypothetical protein